MSTGRPSLNAMTVGMLCTPNACDTRWFWSTSILASVNPLSGSLATRSRIGSEGLARLAPAGPEIDHHRLSLRGFHDLGLEVGLGDFDHAHGVRVVR